MAKPSPTALAVAAVALAAGLARALAFAPTDLYSDEAYYWLWSRRLAPGYFDHPPLVAWLVAAGVPLAPDELGVRLLFLVCGGLTVVFAALLAGELAERTEPGRAVVPGAPSPELLAAIMCAASPLMNLVGGMALPDAPVAAAYTAALWLMARARGPRWLAAGAAVGIALLAKYTAALLAPALLLLVPWDRELRRELGTPWPWLGALLAVAIFAPCLLWNARHEWVSIRFQLGHGFASNATLRSFAEYLAGQLLGAGPVPLALGVRFLAGARTGAAKRAAAAALLPLVVTTWAAVRGKVEANWPALAYPALAAAAAVWLSARARPALARGLAWGSAGLAAALLALFGVEQRAPRLLAGTAAIERFHGWRELARQARALSPRACAEVGCDPARPFVVTASYQYAAALAYYGGFERLGPGVERRSQLDVWADRPEQGEPFLFIGSDGVPEELRAALRAEGERATERVPILHRGQRLRDLTVTPFGRYAGAR